MKIENEILSRLSFWFKKFGYAPVRIFLGRKQKEALLEFFRETQPTIKYYHLMKVIEVSEDSFIGFEGDY